jgi:hypothetical protein
MSIWQVNPKVASKLTLWRINETEFRVTRFDAAAPLLSSPSYILLDKKFEPVLKEMQGQVSWKEAVIHEPLRQIIWENFMDIKITNRLEAKTYDKVDATGLKIWVYGEKYLLVSDETKIALEKLDEGTLQFTAAKSFFAAIKRG